MTERLYYTDARTVEFEARLVRADGVRVVLDRTAFYPNSGGQPSDRGTLNGVAVLDVEEDGDEIVHVLEAALTGDVVRGAVNWERRFDHMQQHSGQHLLSAVFEELFGSRTESFHMGAEVSTVELAGALTSEQMLAAAERANAVVWENRALRVDFEDAATVEGLRKETQREGVLRVVTIAGCDRSACGGTHVSATGEIGMIVLRKAEKIRGNTRVEFVCGARAARKARADYETLAQVGRQFSAPAEETPALVAALQEQLKEAEKARKKLALELAAARGKALWASCGDRKRIVERKAAGALDDETRAVGQSFCAQGGAVYVAASESPASVMLVVSADAGVHAGNVLKPLLAEAGGRGGGAATLAQGSVESVEKLEALLGKLAQL